VGTAVQNIGNDVEVILLVSVGSYVAFEDVIAEIKAVSIEEAAKLEKSVQDAVHSLTRLTALSKWR